jgi:hypothetical protein
VRDTACFFSLDSEFRTNPDWQAETSCLHPRMSADPEASGIALSATADHVAHCFASIIAALEGKVAPRPAFDTSPSWYGALPVKNESRL